MFMYNSKYFKDDEFTRVACSRSDVNDDSLRRLDRAREIAGIPFVLTSVYRTTEDNAKVGGVTNSAHLRGRAFDIQCRTSSQRYRILFGLLAAGFTRIGVGHRFVHADDDPSLPQSVIWLY